MKNTFRHTTWVFLLCLTLIVACAKKSGSSSSGGGSCNGSAVPDDGSTDPFFASQWHLSNSGSGIVDLHLGSVWSTNRGTNVHVNVVDDGMQILHEDLAINVLADSGLNFWVGTSGFSSSATDPTPGSSSLAHGTAVSGLIAARDYNGIGVRGVAPLACLTGINLIATGGNTSSQDGQAMSHNASTTVASNNSWGPVDKLGVIVTSSSSWRSGIGTALSSGNRGKGVSFFWAAGNGARVTDSLSTGFETDNANYDGFANYYGVNAVCAVDDTGARVSYSEKGANLWVCGFAQTTTYNTTGRGLTTTDLAGTSGFNTKSASSNSDTSLSSIGGAAFDYTHGSYTRIMNGTSGATPLVVGVAALMQKENPNLTWRDTRLILAETARKNDSSDSDWTTNQGSFLGSSGNYHINHKYGFGVVDAAAAVALASTWTNVAAEATAYDSGTVTVNSAFSNNSNTGATNAITVSGSNINKVEFVEVYLTATGDIGDIDVRLTNAGGTESVLAEPHSCYSSSSSSSPLTSCGQTYSAWRFGSARHLGESGNQVWTLRVSDRRTGTATSGGTFTSWRLVLHGRAS